MSVLGRSTRHLASFALLVALSCFAVLIPACSDGDEATQAVEVTQDNVLGYWYGTRRYVDEPASTPPTGPVFLHLGGVLAGLDDFGAVAEQVALGLLSPLGRHRVEGDQLIIESFEPTSGFSGGFVFDIVALTRDTMTLRFNTPPAYTVELLRGEGCFASGAWFELATDLEASAFGPDGRLHVIQGGVYGHAVPELCFPFERPELGGSRLAVGPDDVVHLVGMRRDGPSAGIEVTSFAAPRGITDAVEPTTVMLGDASTTTTFVYDHLRIAYAGATPVVTFAHGNQIFSWHERDGTWIAGQTTLPGAETLTPVLMDVTPSPDGGLYMRLPGAARAAFFDGDAWSEVDVPTHPELGAPRVLAFDAAGGLHGAWHAPEADLALWDPLVVGRLESDGTWTTAISGVGLPFGLRVRDDGSYDVAAVPARTSRAVGLTHVRSLASAAWTGRYGQDRVSVVAGLQDQYVAFEHDENIVSKPWASFSAVSGEALIGGGGVPPFRTSFGLWCDTQREEVPRTADTRLVLEFTGAGSATVQLPTLDVACAENCELLVPSRTLLPLTIESADVAQLSTSTPIGLGNGLVSALPDGTWVLAPDPDLAGEDPRTITLVVDVQPAHAVAARTLSPDAPARPISTVAALAGDTSFLVREVEGALALEAYDGAGAQLASQALLAPPSQLSASERGPVLVTGNSPPELVRYDAELRELSRVSLPAPPREHALAVFPDGGFVRVDRLDDGLTSRLTFVSSSDASREVDVELPHVDGAHPLPEGGVAVTLRTDSYARAVGGVEVPAHHFALAGFASDGRFLFVHALPLDAFPSTLVAARGDLLALVTSQLHAVTWPAGSAFSQLPQPSGSAVAHVLRLDPETGAIATAPEAPSLLPLGTLGLSDAGVWTSTFGTHHLAIGFVGWDGAAFVRNYSARHAGECVTSTCVDAPTVSAALANGDLVTFFEHGERALALDRLRIDAVPTELGLRTAFVRLTP